MQREFFIQIKLIVTIKSTDDSGVINKSILNILILNLFSYLFKTYHIF